MIIAADGFNYEGRGDLAKDIIELNSTIRADSLDFIHGNNTYLRRRKLNAQLVTGINTRSLAFRFQKNNLLINKLPVDFSGTLAILEGGYDVDLHVISGITDLANVFAALPPDYEQWFRDTKFSGTSQLLVDLTGPYRSGTGSSPDLSIRLWVRNGSIHHNKAPAPLENLKVRAAAAREEKSIGPKTTKEGFFSNYEHSALYHCPPC